MSKEITPLTAEELENRFKMKDRRLVGDKYREFYNRPFYIWHGCSDAEMIQHKTEYENYLKRLQFLITPTEEQEYTKTVLKELLIDLAEV